MCGFPLYFPLLCFLFCYRALNALIVVNNYWVYIGKAEIACAKKKKIKNLGNKYDIIRFKLVKYNFLG